MKKLFASLTAAAAPFVAALTLAAPAHAQPVHHCEAPDMRTAVSDGHDTTCDFAANVRKAWFLQPGNPVLAYSPVTGRIYSMMCAYGFDLSFYDGMQVTGATHCVDANGGTADAYVW